VAEPHDWPLEQSAQGTLRPLLSDVVGYLLVLFSDPEEAQRAQRALQDQGVPEGDIRLYDSEEILRIAARLQQEQSFLAKAINEVVVDHQLRERWAAAAREGGSHLWVYAPTRERATRLVKLLADCHYELLHYLGENGVETVEGAVGSTLTDQGNDRQDPDDHSNQHAGI
jgi:hypothetical protein